MFLRIQYLSSTCALTFLNEFIIFMVYDGFSNQQLLIESKTIHSKNIGKNTETAKLFTRLVEISIITGL